MTEINSLKGLKHIKDNFSGIAVRIERNGKWNSYWLSELTSMELIDILILWTKQGKEI